MDATRDQDIFVVGETLYLVIDEEGNDYWITEKHINELIDAGVCFGLRPNKNLLTWTVTGVTSNRKVKA